jgi:hypothetical protein
MTKDAAKEANKASSKEEKEVKEKDGAKKDKTPQQNQASELNTVLSKFRPRQRFCVFFLFLLTCVSIFVLYDTCDVRKKKQDCGYSGVTAMKCKTVACFTKGGGDLDKKKITITRKKGVKFGIVAGPKTKESPVYIQSIKEGAVADHNQKLPSGSEDRIYPRDTIMSIDGASGDIRKALSNTKTEKVVIEVKRSRLPSYLRWIHRTSKVNIVEKVLTAPGFQSWLQASTYMGGIGFAVWLLSGYPPASLPFYYFGLSGLVGWHMSKCCHDSNVPGGVPHCYKGGSAKHGVALNRIQTGVESLYAKVKKNPRSYLKWLFLPPTQL